MNVKSEEEECFCGSPNKYSHLRIQLRYQRQQELAVRRILYWAQRLQLCPLEVERMSQEEINCRLWKVQQEERAQDQQKAEFERWKQLQQLRFLMFEEQRKYNESCGGNASIWQILAMAQRELEEKLQIDRMRGSCQRFPSPMSLMESNRQMGGRNRLEPLRSVLSGRASCDNEADDSDSSVEDLEYRKVTYFQRSESDQTLVPSAEISSQTKHSLTTYQQPTLRHSEENCHFHSFSEDSFDSVREPPPLYCPLCDTKHLRMPNAFLGR